ncbi:MAG: hypothetical protein HKN42_06625 [Granulosicoccus sp.]|nr:hypothetical protein [Granulosicoccus sp.]
MIIQAILKYSLKSAVALLLLIALSACGSDESPILPNVVSDPTILDEPVITVEPIIAEGRVEQTFSLLEDSRLRGRFHQSGDSSEGLVAIRSLPVHGVVTLEVDGMVFVYQPDADYSGTDTFRYQTFDGIDVTVNLQVEPVNDAPVLSREFPRVAAQGRLFQHQLSVMDVEGDTLRFAGRGFPDWLTLDATTGQLSGLPTQSDVGVFTGITLSVVDSGGLFDELTDVQFEVIDTNDVPTLNLLQIPRELQARETVTARVFPDDADGDDVELEVEGNAFVSGYVVGSSVTLVASDVNEVTQVNLVIKATDRQGGVAREIVPLTVYPVTASGRGITLSGIKEGRAVHVVVLGDGYADDQQNLFRSHVEQTIEHLRSDAGIVRHFDALSIHMISTVSAQSGADDNDGDDIRDTYYDSTYNCGSIQRLICANTLTMLETAIGDYPDFDQVILLVNDLRYGGSGNSGGSTAITSAYSPEIALHEMGHSLANLADEYVDNLIVETIGFPAFREGSHPNVTSLTDPTLVPWAHWIDAGKAVPHAIGEPGVGLFEGGLYRSKGVYRPTFDSRMRSFDAPFGPVNSERWVLRLYEETDGGIRGFSPATEIVRMIVGESEEFIVSPIFGSDIQSVDWSVDGRTVLAKDDPNRLTLMPEAGRHSVTLTVQDISGVIRKPLPHQGKFTWTWTLEVQ